MGVSLARFLFLLVATAFFGIAVANKNWSHWPPYSLPSCNNKTIIVGESENWHYGFDYSNWAHNYTFNEGDTLVFKYNPPAPFKHSVYSLPTLKSFNSCDLSNATQLGQTSDGTGENAVTYSHKLIAKKWGDHEPLQYFVCGENNGIHCDAGKMKFAVWVGRKPWC